MTKPSSSRPVVRALAAVIERDGRVLLCRRPPGKHHADLWEFPGGKVEDGETDIETVRRELREELGVAVESIGPIEFSTVDPGSGYVIEFLPVRIRGEPVCLEHTAAVWAPPEEVLSYPLPPSDLAYARHRFRASRRRDGDARDSRKTG